MQNLEYPWNILAEVGIIALAAFIIVRILAWLLAKYWKIASQKLHTDPTRYKFLRNAIGIVVWLVALGLMVHAVPHLRKFTSTFFAGAGILVAIVGLAAQQAFSNIIGGIFIVIFKPFRVGDMIKVGSQGYGIVQDITLRHTIVTSFENKHIIIPNSVISNETIINDTIGDPNIRRWVEVSISYESDVQLAKSIMSDVCSTHPLTLDLRTKEEKNQGEKSVPVRTVQLQDSGVLLRAYVWHNNSTQGVDLLSELYDGIRKKFKENGIEIPYPHISLVQK